MVGGFFLTQGEPGYVGDSRRVTLRWGQCFNAITWPNDRRDGHYWWAGDSPAPNGDIETSSANENPSRDSHRARGTIHFVSRTEAIFRSDAGGTLSMSRASPESFHNAGCAMGFR